METLRPMFGFGVDVAHRGRSMLSKESSLKIYPIGVCSLQILRLEVGD